MTELNITEFEGYDGAAFLDFLTVQEDDELKLILPKHTALYRSTHMEIATEYCLMLLLGQKLYELAETFSYELPRMDEKGVFVFYVCTRKREALASLLHLAAQLQDPFSDVLMDFEEEAIHFMAGYERGDLACYDFYVLASNFLLIEDSESDL